MKTHTKAGSSSMNGSALAPIRISIINESTVVSDTEVDAATKALQIQVTRDFAPVWGVDAQLTFVPTGKAPVKETWWLTVLDNSDQAGALGYHDLTPEGLPLGKAFAASDLQYGLKWTVTASHELLEMLGDPNINLAATQEPGRNGAVMTLYAYEVCDACESDDFGYDIDGVTVSDFVYPAWFESFRASGSTEFDYRGKIKDPFELLRGGYISVYDVESGQGWTQLTAEAGPMKYASRPHVGSRRERRRITRACWMTSDVIPHAKRDPKRMVCLQMGSRETNRPAGSRS
jgi:hypothetical protein